MGYNYKNLAKSVVDVKNEDEAKSGKLPEGTYGMTIGTVEYGKEQSGIRTWIFHCIVLSPGTIYHRVAREIRFSERQDFYAKARFQQLIEIMNIWGVNWNWFETPEGMLDVLAAVADTKVKMKVKVSDQLDENGNPNPKYQDFNIEIESLNRINWTDYQQSRGDLPEEEEEETKAPPAKPVAPKAKVAAPKAEEEEEETEEEEVPPPAPKKKGPFA
jgi:hypothetical protein